MFKKTYKTALFVVFLLSWMTDAFSMQQQQLTAPRPGSGIIRSIIKPHLPRLPNSRFLPKPPGVGALTSMGYCTASLCGGNAILSEVNTMNTCFGTESRARNNFNCIKSFSQRYCNNPTANIAGYCSTIQQALAKGPTLLGRAVSDIGMAKSRAQCIPARCARPTTQSFILGCLATEREATLNQKCAQAFMPNCHPGSLPTTGGYLNGITSNYGALPCQNAEKALGLPVTPSVLSRYPLGAMVGGFFQYRVQAPAGYGMGMNPMMGGYGAPSVNPMMGGYGAGIGRFPR